MSDVKFIVYRRAEDDGTILIIQQGEALPRRYDPSAWIVARLVDHTALSIEMVQQVAERGFYEGTGIAVELSDLDRQVMYR